MWTRITQGTRILERVAERVVNIALFAHNKSPVTNALTKDIRKMISIFYRSRLREVDLYAVLYSRSGRDPFEHTYLSQSIVRASSPTVMESFALMS